MVRVLVGCLKRWVLRWYYCFLHPICDTRLQLRPCYRVWLTELCLYTVSQKSVPLFIFGITRSKIKYDFNKFWYTDFWGNLTRADYKFAHFTLKMSPHYLVKCKKSRFATADGWDMAWVLAERGGSLTSGEQDSKLVFRQTVVISNNTCDVCATIFYTV